MKKGIVIILDDREEICHLPVLLEADLVMKGDKILKNRWGKHGTIMEPYIDIQVEQNKRLLLDIFDEITKRKGDNNENEFRITPG